jgi:hypothetical protein
MTQLVNSACVLCGRRIESVVEGEFCPGCGCPVHTGCVGVKESDPGGCATCGAGETVVTRSQRDRRQEDAAVKSEIVRGKGIGLIAKGLALMGIGAGVSLFTTMFGLASGRLEVPAGVLVIVGGALVIVFGVVKVMRGR